MLCDGTGGQLNVLLGIDRDGPDGRHLQNDPGNEILLQSPLAVCGPGQPFQYAGFLRGDWLCTVRCIGTNPLATSQSLHQPFAGGTRSHLFFIVETE